MSSFYDKVYVPVYCPGTMSRFYIRLAQAQCPGSVFRFNVPYLSGIIKVMLLQVQGQSDLTSIGV